MYTACTFRLTQVMQVESLLFVPHVFIYVALAAWVSTLIGLLHQLACNLRWWRGKELPLRHPARC